MPTSDSITGLSFAETVGAETVGARTLTDMDWVTSWRRETIGAIPHEIEQSSLLDLAFDAPSVVSSQGVSFGGISGQKWSRRDRERAAALRREARYARRGSVQLAELFAFETAGGIQLSIVIAGPGQLPVKSHPRQFAELTRNDNLQARSGKRLLRGKLRLALTAARTVCLRRDIGGRYASLSCSRSRIVSINRKCLPSVENQERTAMA